MSTMAATMASLGGATGAAFVATWAMLWWFSRPEKEEVTA